MNYDNHNKTHSIHGLQHFQDLVDGLQTDKNKLVTYRDFYPLSEINLTAHKRGQLKKSIFQFNMFLSSSMLGINQLFNIFIAMVCR